MLKEGDKVPSFSVQDEEGNTISSKDLKGKKYVIYFYPKDDTPGCTKEACSIRDDFAAFRNLDVPVFGVSKDSAASHQKFKQKYKLPFHLLVDRDAALATSFGAYDRKSLFGRIGFGIIRSTFVIDEKGVIEKAFPKVKVAEHSKELLEHLSK
jgi:peroxiredoxin Q/BCP